jgi:ferrous iron transport protein A
MLVPGERGTVRSFSTPAFEVRHRLMEMGLTMGAAIEVIRLAPMGDPIEISVRGYRLSLRRKEASAVMIQKDEAPVLRQGRFRWRHVQR